MSQAALKSQEISEDDEAARREKLKKRTPSKLIKSAEQLFWYQGFQATSLDEIVEAAGLSKGAFFHYFRNKNDVTREVIARYAEEEIFEKLERCFAGSPNIKEGLLNWGQTLYDEAAKRKFKGGCLLGNLALELSDQDEDIRGELALAFLEWENRLVSLFREEGRSGQILMEPRQFAKLVIASMQGALMSAKAHKDQRRAAREFQALAELYERLIKD